jgi:hypothetical protein
MVAEYRWRTAESKANNPYTCEWELKHEIVTQSLCKAGQKLTFSFDICTPTKSSPNISIPFPFHRYSDVRVLGIEVYLAGAQFKGQKTAEEFIVDLVISTNGEYQGCVFDPETRKTRISKFNSNSKDKHQAGGITLKGPFSRPFSYITTNNAMNPGRGLRTLRSDMDQAYFCPTPFTQWTVEVRSPQIDPNSKDITVKVKWLLSWNSICVEPLEVTCSLLN